MVATRVDKTQPSSFGQSDKESRVAQGSSEEEQYSMAEREVVVEEVSCLPISGGDSCDCIHGCASICSIVKRCEGLVWRMRRMRSFAEGDTFI